MSIRIHSTAEVSPKADIGDGTSIWHHCQVREGVKIGQNCILGKGVYLDTGVSIGNNVKIQNYVSLFHGVSVEDGVFIGPHVCFTNDMRPRAINPDGTLKSMDDWIIYETTIRRGAALGANSTIICGTAIGNWAIIGAGSLVSRDIPDYGLVWGNTARLRGFVCPCGSNLEKSSQMDTSVQAKCINCGKIIQISTKDWEKIQ